MNLQERSMHYLVYYRKKQMNIILEVEKPLIELEEKILELKEVNDQGAVDLSSEIEALERKASELQENIYTHLSPWDRVLLARHPQRPTSLDYVESLFTDWFELHGDRLMADDPALVGGFARLDQTRVMVMGHQKGKDTKANLARNFGMASPSGYRKACRLMSLADKFQLPLITFIDTPGAYPGLEAEERGQFEAIARSIGLMSTLQVPVIAVVIGEGGSGGALAIGVGNRVLMLENSIYSVISPEGCASILWRDASKAVQAADALHLTAPDLLKFGIIDEIIPEPLGGAHRDPQAVFEVLKRRLGAILKELSRTSRKKLRDSRYRKFRAMGVFGEENQPSEVAT